jgi:hypothetical protein
MNRGRWSIVLALVALWVLVPAALAAARWPQWWAWIAPEQTPMTWVQSVVLVLAAAGSLLVGYVLRRTTGRSTWIWWLLAGGFFALAVDERFALHERLRDGVLAPRDMTVPFLPWVAAGDFLLMIVAVAGLVVLPFLWRAMGPDKGAKGALALGVLLAVVAVGMDSIDPASWTVAAERIQQTAEEVVELGSGFAFVAAVTFRLLGLLDVHLVDATAERPAESPGGSPAEEPQEQRL